MTTLSRDGGDVEEFFSAVVESFDADGTVRVSTRSSNGEDAMAWIPNEKIPARIFAQLRRGHMLLILVEKIGDDAINTTLLVR